MEPQSDCALNAVQSTAVKEHSGDDAAKRHQEWSRMSMILPVATVLCVLPGVSLWLISGSHREFFAEYRSGWEMEAFKLPVRWTGVGLVIAAAAFMLAVGSAASHLGGLTKLSDMPSSGLGVDRKAWPLFRRKFLRGLMTVCFGSCVLIVADQFRRRLCVECLRVFSYGWMTCLSTGLGALPFVFLDPSIVGDREMALAHTSAGGMMLAASVGLLQEAHQHSGPCDWQMIVGLLSGAIFIRLSQKFQGSDEAESEVEVLHGAIMEHKHFRKALLVFVVMFCHSAAEGIAVGVAFSKALSLQFGHYISLLLAVHNVPEGLAVALVLVPRGVSTPLAGFIAMLTSVPQPVMALAAFRFVDAFEWLLPIGLAFAAGAMIYVSLHELMDEALEQLGKTRTFLQVSGSFALMMAIQVVLHSASIEDSLEA